MKEAPGAENWKIHPGLTFEPSLEAGSLLKGRGCGEDGGVGPTRVSYLRGAGAAGGTGVGDTAVAAEGGAACPMAEGGATSIATTRSVVGGGATAARGEEGLTRGLKEELCPLRVFAMPN